MYIGHVCTAAKACTFLPFLVAPAAAGQYPSVLAFAKYAHEISAVPAKRNSVKSIGLPGLPPHDDARDSKVIGCGVGAPNAAGCELKLAGSDCELPPVGSVNPSATSWYTLMAGPGWRTGGKDVSRTAPRGADTALEACSACDCVVVDG